MKNKKNNFNVFVIIFMSSLILNLGSCKTKNKLTILEMPLQDIVNHEILDVVGMSVIDLPKVEYDPELVRYVKQFLDDAAERGVIIEKSTQNKLRKIVFVDNLSISNEDSVGTIATCNRYYAKIPTMTGNKSMNWMTIEVLREDSKQYVGEGKGRSILLRELMYHELFHCFLNKGHLPEGYDGIMRPVLAIGNRRAFIEWDALVDELFSQQFMNAIPDIQN